MADLHAKSVSSGSSRLDRPPAEQIRRLIEQDRIPAARNLLAVALAADPEDAALLSLDKVLAPPRVQRVAGQESRGYDREFGWLRDNAERYHGRWVAIRGSELLAQAETLQELRALLKPLSLVPPPLVHHLANEP